MRNRSAAHSRTRSPQRAPEHAVRTTLTTPAAQPSYRLALPAPEFSGTRLTPSPPEANMSPLPLADRLRGLRVLIGNTPLLAVECDVGDGQLRRVYAKAEHSNMTGGMKDRMAYHIIRSAINRVYDSCFDPSDPSTVPAGVYQLAKRIERRSSADRRV